VVLALLALYFGRLRHLSFDQGREIIARLQELPDLVGRALNANDEVRRIAHKYAGCGNFLYLGRQFNFPTALEGALKLKEISYIHAEGYPAAEMKHGPIALVDRQTPSVFVMPHDSVYDKVMANLQEIRARGGPVIAVIGEDDREVSKLADDVIHGLRALFAAGGERHSLAVVGLSHRRGPRLRRGQAPQSGQERDRGVRRNQEIAAARQAVGFQRSAGGGRFKKPRRPGGWPGR
jgi:hypothetical protein